MKVFMRNHICQGKGWRFLLYIWGFLFVCSSYADAQDLIIETLKIKPTGNPSIASRGIQFDSNKAFACEEECYATNDGGVTWDSIRVINLSSSATDAHKDLYKIYYFNNLHGFVDFNHTTYRIDVGSDSSSSDGVRRLKLKKYGSERVSISMRSKVGLQVEQEMKFSGQRKIFMTNNGGTTWQDLKSKYIQFNHIDTFDVISNNKIVASVANVSSSGGVGRFFVATNDGGKSWDMYGNSDNIAYDYLVTSVFFLNNMVGWVSSDRNDGLYQTKDGGHEWREVRIPDSERTVSGIYFIDEKRGRIIGGSTNKIYETVDGGDNWLLLSDEKVLSDEFADYFRSAPLARWNDFAVLRTILVGRQKNN